MPPAGVVLRMLIQAQTPKSEAALTVAQKPMKKACSKCGETKPTSEFRPRKTARDGLHGWCHPCYRNYHNEAGRRWRAENRERHLRNQRRQYADNAEWRREQAAGYRDKDREKINARARVYQRRAYKGERRADLLDRMHRRRVATSTTSPGLVQWIADLLWRPCIYCGSTQNIEIDHIVPLSRGGKHEAMNLAPACRRCNRSKKDRLLAEWRQS